MAFQGNTSAARNSTLDGVHALVVGLGREGTALVRFLAERGARLTVTDSRSAEDLSANLSPLVDLPATYALGGHPLPMLEKADILFVSPGVSLDIPLLVEARRRGIPLSSETRLFCRLCPAPVVGITGSSGKTTTTALVGEMLGNAGYRTWVGGNIGQPLIGHLDNIKANDRVVMELSSFQLELFAQWTGQGAPNESGGLTSQVFDPVGWSPSVAAVLNITPNHLDRHPTMEAYVAAKAHILAFQRRGDAAILNADDPVTLQMGRALEGGQRPLWFSAQSEVSNGAFQRDGRLVLRLGREEHVVCATAELRLLGPHNVANALAACALAAVSGATTPALQQTLVTFSGVPHRLELVRERDGVRWYDDSIATTPERALAALRSFPDRPLVLLAGGRDKHLAWQEMAELTCRQVRHVILFGEAADLIECALCAAKVAIDSAPSPSTLVPQSCVIHRAGTLEKAVVLADQVSQDGDTVLLSPGGTSFDAFLDFADRGDQFQQWVKALE